MLASIISFLTAGQRGREFERLARIRHLHVTWKEIPYEQPVQIRVQQPKDRWGIGAVGVVLPESEHGVKRHQGRVELSLRFPGIRNVHVLVRFGKDKVEIRNLHDLAPA